MLTRDGGAAAGNDEMDRMSKQRVRVLANDDNADALRRARSRPCEDLRANEDYDMQAVNIDCLASSVGGKMVFLLAASCARKDISSL